jgi:hypothetical protein
MCICVCEDGVVNFLRLSHSVSLQVYEIVFDITHTKLPTALCCLKRDRSSGVGAANADHRLSLCLLRYIAQRTGDDYITRDFILCIFHLVNKCRLNK